MRSISNEDELDKKFPQVNESEDLKEIKKDIAALQARCEKAGVPIFIGLFESGKGYSYKGVAPELFDTPEMRKEYGKFKRFIQVIMDFNEGMPVIQSLGESQDL